MEGGEGNVAGGGCVVGVGGGDVVEGGVGDIVEEREGNVVGRGVLWG